MNQTSIIGGRIVGEDTECYEGYYLNEDDTCELCSDALSDCDTCSSADQCTSCSEERYYLSDYGTCELCSDAIWACDTCTSADLCTSCIHDSFIVSESSGTCICDNTGYERMILDEETGLCSCEAGYHMDYDYGCLACDYMIPGCASCSEVYWNSLIPLDTARMKGPYECETFLTCN